MFFLTICGELVTSSLPNLQLHHALIEATIEVGDVVKHTEDKGESTVVVVAHIVFLV